MRPRVLFLSHMYPNGINPFNAPFMSERAIALSRLVDLDIIAPVGYFPFFKNKLPPYLERFNGMDVRHPRYFGVPSYFWKKRWISYYMMCRSLWEKTSLPYDIAHIEWIYPDAYAFLHYARMLKIRTVGVVHGNEAIGYFESKSHRPHYKKALKRLERIIAVSADMKRKMIAEYEVEPEKIVVIHNGADLTKFPVIDKFEARMKINLPLSASIGICVARLSPEKNLDVLIEAIAMLGENAPLMYIVGDGPLRDKLAQMIRKKNVDAKIKLAGPVPHNEIHNWLNACDFFCLPSQREGCPVVIHEALACGLPVISTTVGAIPEQICSDDYGLLCQPSSAKELSALIAKTSIISWDRKKICTYGRRFTWQNVALQTVKVLEEAIG